VTAGASIPVALTLVYGGRACLVPEVCRVYLSQLPRRLGDSASWCIWMIVSSSSHVDRCTGYLKHVMQYDRHLAYPAVLAWGNRVLCCICLCAGTIWLPVRDGHRQGLGKRGMHEAGWRCMLERFGASHSCLSLHVPVHVCILYVLPCVCGLCFGL